MVRLKEHDPLYQEAVSKLNALQSNAVTLQKLRKKRELMQEVNVPETLLYLKLLGIKPEDIDRLKPIHVSGTKGKGSTCAFVECILRQSGFKTGFYSSPHLMQVRERIKINGSSLTESAFASYFTDVYNQLRINNGIDGTMPAYFKFLTLMAFYVFIREKVDVAVIEVGIGGENPVVCGVTTLDFDHTRLLGSTLKEIAWQKGGIFKPNSVAVVADQSEETLECELHVVPPLSEYTWPAKPVKIGIGGMHQNWNVSLALQVARLWLERTGNSSSELQSSCRSGLNLNGFAPPASFINGLRLCSWPGRSQVLKLDNITYFIDGAHTPKSLQCCLEWYLSGRNKTDPVFRILIFHCTADRTPESLLPPLKDCGFDAAFFCPACVHRTVDESSDQTNYNQGWAEQMLKVEHNAVVWNDFAKDSYTEEFGCISEVFDKIQLLRKAHDEEIEVLITGSLHLVGGCLLVLDTLRGESCCD
ncbi:unnamed protein product [Enterobius vermicularis]|uniref:tetrahydrofolate synthase n=1 Tax=Enterobius vermicularis TaxID=51028 RepID=A0A0N4VKT4_ENTVE|nr:unnamed protein product [Enterobius vermicularis]